MELLTQVKEESTKKVGTDEELMAELKLQGLSEDQANCFLIWEEICGDL